MGKTKIIKLSKENRKYLHNFRIWSDFLKKALKSTNHKAKEKTTLKLRTVHQKTLLKD